MGFNPNWPQVELAWAPYWTCDGGAVPQQRYADLTDRTRVAITAQRGSQYELDQVRAGEGAATLSNLDGALDPSNSGGPWAGHIMPYQPWRLRAQWPASVNLLSPAQATAGDSGGVGPGPIPGGNDGIDVWSSTDSSGGLVVATGSAWQGGQVFQFAVPASTAAGTAICYGGEIPVEPGVTFSNQARVRNVTPSTSVQVWAYIKWLAADQTTISVAAGTLTTLVGASGATWTYISVAGTAPAHAAAMWYGVQLAATPSAATSVQVDGWQFERAAAPSGFVVPGTWHTLMKGFVERWPADWSYNGTYGLITPTAVDALALLSQVQLTDPLTAEITARTPAWLFPLAEGSGSTSFSDLTGNRSPAQTGVSKYGYGTLSAGTKITAVNGEAGMYLGSSGSVVTFNNPNYGLTLSACTFLSLTAGGVKGPADPTLWTRMIAFRTTQGIPQGPAVIWSSIDNQRDTDPDGSRIQLEVLNNATLSLTLAGSDGVQQSYGFAQNNVCDGNWHLALFGFASTLGQVLCSLDGDHATSYFFGVPSSLTPTGLIGDSLGAFVDLTDGNGCAQNWNGDISFLAEFPYLFTPSDITAIYQAWKNAFEGELSGYRYSRILGYAGYQGAWFVDQGVTVMGPATDIAGIDAVSALQSVVDSENGAHYVDSFGHLRFEARTRRYNQTTPAYVFGENTAGGEWPYEDCKLDYDPTHLANDVQITQHSTGQLFRKKNTTSQTLYFPRTLTRTVNADLATECQAAAEYLATRYGQPQMRVSTLVLHPSAYPAMWPVCLSLELGTRVRIMRRPPNATPIQVDAFVESIAVDLDDRGEATWTLQCSPADLTSYGQFASFHSTLASAATAGASSVVVNHGQDNVNVAAAQIAVGQQFVLDEGQAAQETVTVASVGVTASGWSSVTLTLTAALANNHSSGAGVCEPLPAGISDPTTWDLLAKFDSMAVTY